MRRLPSTARPDWKRRVESQGLLYHTSDDGLPYWNEYAHYRFSLAEIETFERVGAELHAMVLEACRAVIEEGGDPGANLRALGIPATLHPGIVRSWGEDQWELYGRFDLAFSANDGVPKLIEYNADTPTGLLEASAIQWYWKEDRFPALDQFNRLHPALVARWRTLAERGQLDFKKLLHFTSVGDHPEDEMTTAYLAETAREAGFAPERLRIDAIGFDADRNRFLDLRDRAIDQLFKLYPWEWMGQEEFGPRLATVPWTVVEPPWKAIIASKGLLAVLGRLFPDSPYLLRAALAPEGMRSHVRKPFFGREGANVSLVIDGRDTAATDGPHAEGPFLYQEYAPLFQSETGGRRHYAQVGLWMIGPEACGIGVREDTSPILGNTSQFVPHVIE